MTKNITKLVKDTKLQQIQEAQRENLKATTTKHTLPIGTKLKVTKDSLSDPFKQDGVLF